MPNVVKVLKEEIHRISRKEAKAAVAPIRRPSVKVRKDVAALKRRMAVMEKAAKLFQAFMKKTEQALPAPSPDKADKARITAKGIRSLRKKLRLSQTKFATLLGVSTQIVQVWEKKQGGLSVRDNTKAAILSVRDMGAREAQQRLDEMKPTAKPKKQRKARKAKKQSKAKRPASRTSKPRKKSR